MKRRAFSGTKGQITKIIIKKKICRSTNIPRMHMSVYSMGGGTSDVTGVRGDSPPDAKTVHSYRHQAGDSTQQRCVDQ